MLRLVMLGLILVRGGASVYKNNIEFGCICNVAISNCGVSYAGTISYPLYCLI